jgi:hypothetical protein
VSKIINVRAYSSVFLDPSILICHLVFFKKKTTKERNQASECHVSIKRSQKNTKMNSSISHVSL